MKITIIYGKMIKSTTYNNVQLLLEQINSKINSNVTEFFFPRDLPRLCCGCFLCFEDKEYVCPNFNDAKPIMKSLYESDLIILTCPSYNSDESIKIKSFFNTLSYRWMPHREDRPIMSNKIGLVISGNDNTILNSTAKVIVNSLRLWGIKKIYTVSDSQCLLNLNILDLGKNKKLNKKIYNIATKILALNEEAQKASKIIHINSHFT